MALTLTEAAKAVMPTLRKRKKKLIKYDPAAAKPSATGSGPLAMLAAAKKKG